MCYHCSFKEQNVNKLLKHCFTFHLNEKFSIRRRVLDTSDGQFRWNSLHFPCLVKDIKTRVDKGAIPMIDLDKITMRYKRRSSTELQQNAKVSKLHSLEQDSDEDGVKQSAVKCCDIRQEGSVLLDNAKQNDAQLYDKQDNAKVLEEQELNDDELNNGKPDIKDIDTFKNAYEVLKMDGRGEDFMAVLSSLSNGTLHPSNIALHLLLDIGNLLSQVSCRHIRYNKTSLDFWAIVHGLFKGKATRFFRGSMPAPQSTHEGIYIDIDKERHYHSYVYFYYQYSDVLQDVLYISYKFCL